MSPWLPKELRVVFGPDQVTLVPVQRTLSWRGLGRTAGEPHTVAVPGASGAQPWRPALQALETALADFASGKTAATLVLSNHFLRYAVVPWRAELVDAQEELAYTRHCFTRVYGKAALQWEIRLSDQAPEMPRLASAVDTQLLAALRGVFDGAGMTLRSIQPHLMSVFNRVRGQLRQPSAWFALLEPGNLCLALLHNGHWSRVRSHRVGSTWRAELSLILERESYLADEPTVPHEVYVWTSQSDEAGLPQSGPWQFQTLTPGHFSMAMAG